MTNGEHPQVLIVGAGPTGLTLACELARRHIAFRLIEAAPSPQPGSRGKGIQPRTLEVFHDLGIVDRVLANGRMAMPMRARAPDGSVTTTGNDPITPRADVPYASTLVTPEWRVEEALRLLLTELGGTVEFGTALQSFEQTADQVTAHIVHNDVPETITTPWLIGCDGGHSIVRKQAGIHFEGETRDEIRMIVADIEVDGLDREAWHMWSHAEGMVSLCPLPSTNAFQFQASIAPGQNTELSLVNMQAIFNQRSSRNDIHLHPPQWSSLWRCNVRLVDRYRARRVFLAGDAAHIHSPAGGQGMNTGIQDAQNLGWKLAAVIAGANPALLDTYEAERRPIAAGVLALSNARLKEAIEQKSIVARRDKATMQLGIHYRDSTLSRDRRPETASLRAGDRAPDATGLATLQGEHRLFDLTRGGQFTLLNFGPALAMQLAPFALRIIHVVPQPAGPNDVADPAGQLAKTYGATSKTFVLIRPDGYIALISDTGDASQLQHYFTALTETSTTHKA